jgi:hypothetical protein
MEMMIERVYVAFSIRKRPRDRLVEDDVEGMQRRCERALEVEIRKAVGRGMTSKWGRRAEVRKDGSREIEGSTGSDRIGGIG